MTPGLLLPAGLAALAALIVPLVIHIARRSEQQPTDFAALRWLRQKPRPRSRLRFDEWPLLLLRLLLLTFIAVWLARPVLSGAVEKAPYIAVIPGADLAQARAVIGKGRGHWLAPGAPDLDQPPPEAKAAVASLIRQLDAELPPGAALIVVAPQVIGGADAERPRLSRPVTWRVVAGVMPARAKVLVATPPLSFRSDREHAAALGYFQAAALAWQPPGRAAGVETAAIDADLPNTNRRLIWLGAGTLPAALLRWVELGGVAVVSSDAAVPEGPRATVWRDALDRPFVEATPLGAGRLMRFTRPLTPAETPELLNADFPVRLRAAFDGPATAPARVAATDYAPLTGARAFDPAPQDVRPWLALLIGLLLLGERCLATRRSRGVTP